MIHCTAINPITLRSARTHATAVASALTLTLTCQLVADHTGPHQAHIALDGQLAGTFRWQDPDRTTEQHDIPHQERDRP